MPVGQFPGTRSWGYDGVLPFAPQHTYGGPEGLQRLVEACHRKGLAVFLDVVYNHFGPEGNVFPLVRPLPDREVQDRLGPRPQLRRPGLRPGPRLGPGQRRGCGSATTAFDGLRLDAADQIYDRSPRHILAEVAEVAHAEAARLGRPVHVFAETDHERRPALPPPARARAATASTATGTTTSTTPPTSS